MGSAKSRIAKTPRTSIGVKIKTKERLDHSRHPGQSYDGFVWQLIDLWEKIKKG